MAQYVACLHTLLQAHITRQVARLEQQSILLRYFLILELMIGYKIQF